MKSEISLREEKKKKKKTKNLKRHANIISQSYSFGNKSKTEHVDRLVMFLFAIVFITCFFACI